MNSNNLSSILSLCPETLIETQHNLLKKHVISVLNNIIKMIDSESYEYILDKENGVIRFTIDCDDFESYFIDFDYGNGTNDIYEIVSKLQRLKTQAESSSQIERKHCD